MSTHAILFNTICNEIDIAEINSKNSDQDMKITILKNDKVVRHQENNIDFLDDREHVANIGYN